MISLNFYYYPQLNFEYNRIGDYSADNLSTTIISSTAPEIGGGDLENWSNIDYEEVYDRAEGFLIQQLNDESSTCYELFANKLKYMYDEDKMDRLFGKSFNELDIDELEGVAFNYLDKCSDIWTLLDETAFKEINGELDQYCVDIANNFLESSEFKKIEHDIYESIFYKVQDALEDFHSIDYEMDEEGYVEAKFSNLDDDSLKALISRLKAITPYAKEKVSSYIKPIEAKLSNGFVVFKRIPSDFDVKLAYHAEF